MFSYADLKPHMFGALFTAANLFFAWSVWRMARLARLGQDIDGLFDNPVDRIGKLMRFGFGQKKVVEYKFGYNHALIFSCFLVIVIGHSEFLIRGVFPSFSLHFLGDTVYSTILIGQDVMAFVVLFALANAVFRRVVIKPKHIHYESIDAFRIIGLIFWVMVSYFAAMGAGLAGGHPDVAGYGKWMPISNIVSGMFNPDYGELYYELWWWVHAFILLGFMNYLPYSKHMHLIWGLPNIYMYKDTKPRAALSTIDFEAAESYGAGKVSDFSWKSLIDTYACTECGRCDLNCPANNTGKPLQPQRVIHDMRVNLMVNGGPLLAQKGVLRLHEFAQAPEDWEPAFPLIAETEAEAKEGQISKDVLWSCTACGACVEACPVLIDHVDAIMDMRRYLTLMEGDISPELALTFKNIENNYNPWGIGADKRADWAKDLGLKFWGGSEDKDKFEYLFWVGCAGSYDARAQKTMQSFTKILDNAAISYAILGTNERCTGDPVRRTGNEYMFDEIAKSNVATLNDFGVQKIVTACPHCLNTLKNEYPAFGGEYEVLHHSQLIDGLISTGRIELDEVKMQSVVFHDPCYLGRWNGEYEAPRRTLAAVRRLSLVEVEGANKERSMCCGAGGGQMWMEEHLGTRVNTERTKQVLDTGADTIAVACPFCMTMIEDGVKEHGRDEEVRVVDVAEVVASAMISKADRARAGASRTTASAASPELAGVAKVAPSPS